MPVPNIYSTHLHSVLLAETPLLQLAEKIKGIINATMDSPKDIQRLTSELPIFEMIRRTNSQDKYKLRFRPKLSEVDLVPFEEKLGKVYSQLGI